MTRYNFLFDILYIHGVIRYVKWHHTPTSFFMLRKVKCLKCFQKLKEFLECPIDKEFGDFFRANELNVAVWTWTINAHSAQSIFNLWKDRYSKLPSVDQRQMQKLLFILFPNYNHGTTLIPTFFLNLTTFFNIQYADTSLWNRIMTCTQQDVSLLISNMEVLHQTLIVYLQTDFMNEQREGNIREYTIPCHVSITSITDRYHTNGSDMLLLFYAFQSFSKNNFENLRMEKEIGQILNSIITQKNSIDGNITHCTFCMVLSGLPFLTTKLNDNAKQQFRP
ncbi:hypothetical protein BDA99DRAFT_535824 [Phascolomyces articulosus]|uniref:Uncharacterized protein n=1 Tax=Phascolomyces articulosus TaxID=60185 RepID=A0AAD5KJ79_9FUNG|nr:hypothetical protein BDA99DRAFT_535824 [Phascolomyces articulosus]